MAKDQPGTISRYQLFPDEKGAPQAPSPAAAASGLRQADNSSALWLVGLIGVLVAVRWIWERSK